MAPALIIGLPIQGVAEDHVMHLSIGTALAVMATTSAYVAILRYQTGDLQMSVTYRFVPYIVIGAVGGSLIGDFLPGYVLKAVFMAFIALTIVRGIFYKGHETITAGGDLDQVRGLSLWFHGVLTGITGSLLGPGPAIVVGPYLRKRRYSMPMIAATASALAGLLGLSASVVYIYGGLNETDLPNYSFGFLYTPAFAGLAIGALIGSPGGVRISHKIRDILIHRMFISYLAIILFVMVVWGL